MNKINCTKVTRNLTRVDFTKSEGSRVDDKKSDFQIVFLGFVSVFYVIFVSALNLCSRSQDVFFFLDGDFESLLRWITYHSG